MSINAKFCKDCKWIRVSGFFSSKHPVCLSPDVNKDDGTFLVNGTSGMRCDYAREPDHSCGAEAVYWTENEKG